MATKPLSEILAAKQQVEGKLLKQPGVTGIDVGYKYVGGKPTDDIAIRVMVKKKKKSVPKQEKVPETIEGVKTDVIERTFFLHAPRNRKPVEELDLQSDGNTYDPVKGGISVGPVRAVAGQVWAGTLGVIVRDNSTGNPLLLSNFHVLAVDENARTGDGIAQPSLVDGGRAPASVVGALQRTALTGTVDGAVASLQGRGYSGEVIDIGPITGTAAAVHGTAVRKRGRTTGLTYGIVDGIAGSITLPYPGGIGSKTLANQIDVRPDPARNAQFADHGDSGAVLVDDGGRIVGLHFAGSNDGHGLANPIADVLAALDVSIVAGSAKSTSKDDLSDSKAAQVKEAKIEKEKTELLEKQKAEILEKQKEKNETKDFKDIETITPDKSYQPTESGGPTMSGQGKEIEGKLPDKPGVDKPVKSDKEKVEIKEHKPEAKELKPEFKEHKNEAKELKNEAKEHKPEFKEHKNEHKEFKIELKEHIKPELEKPFRENIKELVEGGQKFAEGDPIQQVPTGSLQGASSAKFFDSGPGIKVPLKDLMDQQGASPQAAFKLKDFTDKPHKDIEKFHKDLDKTHKDFDKTHKDKDFEKLIFEGGGKQISEGVDPFQLGSPQLQAAGAAAAIKQTDKIIEKNLLKPEGKIEIKDHKNENKEFKVEKIEHKIELKEHKSEIKELKGEKDFKIEQKEHGKPEFDNVFTNQKQVFEGGPKLAEGGDPFGQNVGLQAASLPVGAKHAEKVGHEKALVKDKIEIKDFKIEVKEHKNEFKDHKDEKQEFKVELKDAKLEFEKPIPENPKQLVEGGPQLPGGGGDPVKPGTPAPGLQGASEPKDDSKKQGAAAQGSGGAQAGGSGASAAQKFPKLELEKHDKFPKIEFEKHPKLEIEKAKFEGEKIKFEGEKIKFEKEKELIFDKGKNEFEKILQEGPKTIAEGPGPVIPNQPDPVTRLAQLEAAVAQLSTFIPQHLRPDLGGGALINEPDHKSEQKTEAKSEQKAESKSDSKPDPKRKRG